MPAHTNKMSLSMSSYWVLFTFQLWASALVLNELSDGCTVELAPFVRTFWTLDLLLYRLFKRKYIFLGQICAWDTWAAEQQVISQSCGSHWPTRSSLSAWWRCISCWLWRAAFSGSGSQRHPASRMILFGTRLMSTVRGCTACPRLLVSGSSCIWLKEG